jgi:hypothetical protein
MPIEQSLLRNFSNKIIKCTETDESDDVSYGTAIGAAMWTWQHLIVPSVEWCIVVSRGVVVIGTQSVTLANWWEWSGSDECCSESKTRMHGFV